MITVHCPGCEREVDVDVSQRRGNDRLRTTCPACQARFAVRVNQPDVVLWEDGGPSVATSVVPSSDPDSGADDHSIDGDGVAGRFSLSEGTFEMPGDPDMEESQPEPRGRRSDGDGERRNSVIEERPVTDDPRTETGKTRHHDAEQTPSGGKDSSGQRRRRMVVTNLPAITGYRFEPLGMVAHHFCRPGGGDGKLARQRVRAFGDRYRHALELLGQQAQEIGADTVLGVEIQIVPTGGPDASVWVLVQGTAVRRHRIDADHP